jgi:hypothetical protein
MTTAAALLLTWTVWWMAVVGSSAPARRPFYTPGDAVPALIAAATNAEDVTVFQFALHGGWPTGNSVVRLVAALVAVAASFSFAYLAAFLPERSTRVVFSGVLALVGLFACVAFVMDAISVSSTRSECNAEKCTTAVPQSIIDSGAKCKCSPDAWFYLTILVDIILFVSSAACLVCAALPLFKGGAGGNRSTPGSSMRSSMVTSDPN